MKPGLRVLMLLASVVVSAGVHAAGAGPWELASDSNGIRVYTQAVPGQDLKNFRGVVRVHAPMRQVLAALVDVERMPQWFFNLREARFLEVGGPDGTRMYLWLKGIWPVSDRDAVVALSHRQDVVTGALHLNAVAAPEGYPLMRERVRIPRMQSGWVITPVSATVTEIQLNGNADPGGRIPVWLANLVVTLMPKETLKNLRMRLQTRGMVSAAILDTDPRVKKMLGDVKLPGNN